MKRVELTQRMIDAANECADAMLKLSEAVDKAKVIFVWTGALLEDQEYHSKPERWKIFESIN